MKIDIMIPKIKTVKQVKFGPNPQRHQWNKTFSGIKNVLHHSYEYISQKYPHFKEIMIQPSYRFYQTKPKHQSNFSQ